MKKLYNVIALVMMSSFMFAQGSVSGTVTDGAGNALFGANVTVEGTSSGAATAADGSYSVDGVSSGSYTVTASYIGYESASVSVNVDGSATANFSLASSAVSGNSVSVLGSRFARNVDEQAVPVEVITELEIRASGFTETNELLQALVPSYNSPKGYITDGSDHMRPATLRGMAPNQTLVLVNGKRRHQGALVHVNGSVGRGSTQVDLNAIPASAISKIEVLRDGAAAKYGSDAVAGVINLILKETGGADMSITYGQNYSYFERGYAAGEGLIDGQDENTYSWDLDTDHEGTGYLPYSADRGYARSGLETVLKEDGRNLIIHAGNGMEIFGGNLYLSGQIRDGGRTNRAGLDPRRQYFAGMDAEEHAFDRENHRIGAGKFEQVSLMWNGSFPTERGTFYTFGGYNTRDGESGCYYRRAQDNRTLRAWYPDGFLPLISPELSDKSFAFGMKGLMGDYAYDLSLTNGSNDFAWGMTNSHNATYGTGPGQQSDFDLGTLGYSQTTINFDLTTQKEIDGFAGPVSLAMGAEIRSENYTIEAGEEAGYADGGFDVLDGPNAGAGAAVGCQCLPGLAPNNEQDRDRDALSFYVDAEADVKDGLLVNVAVRAEDYSDFGNHATGKVAMRYEIQDGLAARGSISTGFRAPALQEAYFSSIATNFIDGIPYEVGTFPVDTEPAKALGAKPLEPETSQNISMGMTYKDDTFSLAVDAYSITVDDRITMSETFKGSGATSDMATFFADRGIPAVGGRYFFNGINTETNGLDIVATMNRDLANGTLLLKAAMNFNDTEVTNKGDLVTPAALADYTGASLLGRSNTVRFESSSPAEMFQFSARVQKPTSTLMVKMNRWGEVTIPSGSVEREQVLSGQWTTDMEYSFQATSQVRLSFGMNNVFDVYPDKTIKRNSFNGIFQHSGYSPFGFNGRYVYTRLDMTL
ncbi:MAG TPA: TonB-dependent receptor [Candidatus Marinimicrobia bacterium]|nr:TonB-dependent receptor [Candidatus Neomarinimicrobiota bacterium]|tara:strand:- start:8161 stop:10947 length:2787 start_codon:yes stop_codon:yes gene_type:complete